MRKIWLGASTTLAAVVALGIGGTTLANDEGAMKHRQSVMKAVGGHMGAMTGIVKEEVGFKEDLKSHATAMADLSKIAAKAFPKGSNVGQSAALPAIWEKPDEFMKVAAGFQAEAAKLAEAANKGDMQAFAAQLSSLGQNGCKPCHDSFRQKK